MKSSERVVAAAQPEVGSARRPTRAGVGGMAPAPARGCCRLQDLGVSFFIEKEINK